MVDPGEENPLPVRILDVRDLTWNIVATTSDEKVAESFNIQRHSDGREYIDAEIPNPETVQCNLVFPHNGDELEGIIYKADSMDIKWDIYIYDATFLFVRSWTGQLQYRAFAEITDTNIRINQIQTAAKHIETAPQAVYFILGTHALGRVLPHTIPADIPDTPEQNRPIIIQHVWPLWMLRHIRRHHTNRNTPTRIRSMNVTIPSPLLHCPLNHPNHSLLTDYQG